jgi:hypothetical protein
LRGDVVDIAFGRSVGPAFKSKVIAIASDLDCDPSHLMACMAFETGERFRSNTRNAAGSGAVGLIQFMPSTARALGTTTQALAAMSEVDQLDFVKKYMLPFKGKLDSLSDVYMAILMPAFVGKPDSSILFRKGTKAYEQNKGLDANKDGTITKAEAASKVQAKIIRGMRNDLRG